jgi:RNA ligase
MTDAELHAAMAPLIAAGMVTRRTSDELAIYNYTHTAQRANEWTPGLRAARGLVFHEPSRRVVARPFPKFFNLGERPETLADALPWERPHEITEKLDGSLGVVFRHAGRWRVATRGAFESEQAVYARERLLNLYDLDACPTRATVLVEIIYPGNRVVVDYGDREGLSLLAVIDTATGQELKLEDVAGLAVKMSMPRAGGRCNVGRAPSQHEANSEGYVIRWPHSGLRVKIKSPDYVAAHRMLDQVAPRRVLEILRDGKQDDVRAQLPRHARDRFDGYAAELSGKIADLESSAGWAYRAHRGLLEESRKAFALAIKDMQPAVKALAFALADGRDTWTMACDLVRKTLKPDADE